MEMFISLQVNLDLNLKKGQRHKHSLLTTDKMPTLISSCKKSQIMNTIF